MANSVTAVLFSLLLPSCLPGIKLDGAGAVNVTQARTTGGTLTLATWNVLSVSKCETSANGFPGMQPEAFKFHNKGCLDKGQKACTSEWIQEVIPEFFNKFKLDAAFLQEIDNPMLQGLTSMMGNKKHLVPKGEGFQKRFQVTPISGSGDFLEISEWLLKTKMEEDGVPAKDSAFVVWDTTKLEKLECRLPATNIPAETLKDKDGKEITKDGKPVVTKKDKPVVLVKAVDLSKVGLCTITKDGTEFDVLGMHADGDKGFTEVQAKRVMETVKRPIQAVLGDLNRDDKVDVEKAIEGLGNSNLVVPATEGQFTVYRMVHPYRKLIQAVQNSKLVEHTGPVHCTNGVPDKSIPGYISEKMTFCPELHALQGMIEGQNYADLDAAKEALKVNKDFKDGKVIKLLLEVKFDNKVLPYDKVTKRGGETLWVTMTDPAYDWKDHFAGDFGLDPKTFQIVEGGNERAKTYIKPEVKREDWVAYDKTAFELVKTHVSMNKYLHDYTHVNGEPSVHGKAYPVYNMASDHLPVIMKLTFPPPQQKKSSRASARIRSKTPFKPFNRFVRRALRAFVRSGSAKS